MKLHKHFLASLAAVLLVPFAALDAAENTEGITWLIDYEGKALPDSTWTATGKLNTKIEDGALHLVDDSTDFGSYRAAWKAQPSREIIVEAKVKVGAVTGSQKNKSATSLWPWRDGAPVMVQISDGRHQEGLVLFPAQATSFTDRFIPMDTTKEFHTY